LLGGKVGRGEKNVSPSPSKGHQTLEPSIGHQTLEPSIGHQTLEPFKGHQIDILFHLFLFKERIWIIWGFFSNIIFDLILENTYSYNFPWEKKND
jgi:hypothetical protein